MYENPEGPICAHTWLHPHQVHFYGVIPVELINSTCTVNHNVHWRFEAIFGKLEAVWNVYVVQFNAWCTYCLLNAVTYRSTQEVIWVQAYVLPFVSSALVMSHLMYLKQGLSPICSRTLRTSVSGATSAATTLNMHVWLRLMVQLKIG